ncbi:MAG TPA: HDIG domain-containing metalloprotein [Candidatus Methylacidiphilales bacterium]
MIGWFQRKRLVSKGLAIERQRKTHSREWRTFLESSPLARAVVCLGYAGFSFLCGTYEAAPLAAPLYLLVGIFFVSSIMLLYLDLQEVWRSNSKLVLLFGSIGANLVLNRLFLYGSLYVEQISLPDLLFWVPSAFAPLLITVLLGPRAGLYTVVVAGVMESLLVASSFNHLVISLIIGFTAVFFSRNVRRRNDLIRAGVAVGVAGLVCAVSFGLLNGSVPGLFLKQAVLGIGVGVLTALVVSSILPILETVFEINTNMSLIELADLNHPLLRQLTMEAPGTYHHSLMVANLAEAAAQSVGANGTLCRVMAYFHDIGKLKKPEYFVENAGANGTGENPHDALSPTMSSLIIISHVKEGVDLAVKNRLKKPIIQAIQEHHGTTQIYYFYRRAVQMAQDARAGSEIMNLREEDIPDVPEENFLYPGPIPQSKETGILMMADVIEGASRSLEKPTPQRIEDMVRDLVSRRVAEGQLDDSGLSLKEIRQASESFVFTLKTMMHSRISYPKHEPLQQQPPPAPGGPFQPAKRAPGGGGSEGPRTPDSNLH